MQMWLNLSASSGRFVGKTIELIETETKYEGYIAKALDQVEKMKRMEEKRIPADIDWDDIDSIATEARQKFKLIAPETIGQASRISMSIQQIFPFLWSIWKGAVAPFQRRRKR